MSLESRLSETVSDEVFSSLSDLKEPLESIGLKDEGQTRDVITLFYNCTKKKTFAPQGKTIAHLGVVFKEIEAICSSGSVEASEEVVKSVQQLFYDKLIERDCSLKMIDLGESQKYNLQSGANIVRFHVMLAGERYHEGKEISQSYLSENGIVASQQLKDLLRKCLFQLSVRDDLDDKAVVNKIVYGVEGLNLLEDSEKEAFINAMFQSIGYMKKRCLKDSDNQIQRAIKANTKKQYFGGPKITSKLKKQMEKESKQLYRHMLFPASGSEKSLPLFPPQNLSKIFLEAPYYFEDARVSPADRNLDDFLELNSLSVEQISAPLVDSESYLDNRVPKSISRILKYQPTKIEAFLGRKEEMIAFFEKHQPDYEFRGSVAHSQNSFDYQIFAHKSNLKDFKIVVTGIPSRSKLVKLFRTLKAAGVPLEEMGYRGNFQRVAEVELQALETLSSKWPEVPSVVFIGSDCLKRESDLTVRGKSFNIMTKPKDPRYKKCPRSTSDIDNNTLVKGSYYYVESRGAKPFTAMSFRMPNGELSYDVVKKLLQKGVKKIVMIGAGGYIERADQAIEGDVVGRFQPVKTSSKDDKVLSIDDDIMMQTEGFGEYFLQPDHVHSTVNCVLDEDELWLNTRKKRGEGSVDVEVFHVMSAVNDYITDGGSKDFKVLPGVFISDVVGDEDYSIAEKISGKNAFQHTSSLIGEVLYQTQEEIRLANELALKKSGGKRVCRDLINL